MSSKGSISYIYGFRRKDAARFAFSFLIWITKKYTLRVAQEIISCEILPLKKLMKNKKRHLHEKIDKVIRDC